MSPPKWINRMFKVVPCSSDRDIGWFTPFNRFPTEEDAHEWAVREVNASKQAYCKCVEYNIDVPYFTNYVVQPA